MTDERLPARTGQKREKAESSFADGRKLWARIEAFLSLKAVNTQETYRGIIVEWCDFLGAPAGSDPAARKFLAAEDLHALAYRKWLERRPGERPRIERSKGMKASSERLVSKQIASSKRDGLQHSLSNATIAKKFAALRRIYKVVAAAGLFDRLNPFDSDRVPAPSREAGRKRPTEMLEYAAVKKLLASIDTSEPKGLRDRAIFSALFGGGLRRSEVRNLRLADFKRSQKGTYHVYLRSTKARKDANQALPDWAGRCVESLVANRREEGAGDSDYIFVSYTGKGGQFSTNRPISVSGIYKMFLARCRAAGLKDYLTPHSARATAITRLLDSGFTHREVREFSRHSSVQMVEVYDKRRMSIDESPARDLDFEDD